MKFIIEQLRKEQELAPGLRLCRHDVVYEVDEDNPVAISTSYQIHSSPGIDGAVSINRGSNLIYQGTISEAKGLRLVEGDEIIINLS